jgi:GT2 family glycosyltransferase
VILVDNASKDGTAEMVEQDFPEVMVIRSPKNLGFPSACNLALAKAEGRYFVLFNSDTELVNDAFSELVRFMDATPDCGIACPQLYYFDGRVQISHYKFRDPAARSMWEVHPRLKELKYLLGMAKPPAKVPKKKEKTVPAQPVEVERPRGVCFMMRMKCADEIGPMDGNFFIFADEVDWAWRAKKAGWKRHIVPAAKVNHMDHASVSKHASLMAKVQTQSVYYYNYKHFGWKAWLQLRLGNLLGALVAYLLYVLSISVAKGKGTQSSEDYLADARRLFTFATLTKKVLPPDAV